MSSFRHRPTEQHRDFSGVNVSWCLWEALMVSWDQEQTWPLTLSLWRYKSLSLREGGRGKRKWGRLQCSMTSKHSVAWCSYMSQWGMEHKPHQSILGTVRGNRGPLLLFWIETISAESVCDFEACSHERLQERKGISKGPMCPVMCWILISSAYISLTAEPCSSPHVVWLFRSLETGLNLVLDFKGFNDGSQPWWWGPEIGYACVWKPHLCSDTADSSKVSQQETLKASETKACKHKTYTNVEWNILFLIRW